MDPQREARVRQRLKERIRQGTLPHPSQTSAWGCTSILDPQQGVGALCVAEDGRIKAGGQSHGLQCRTATLWFHDECRAIWNLLE